MEGDAVSDVETKPRMWDRDPALVEMAKLCLADFPEETIGKLPRVTCYESPKCTSKTPCAKHRATKCATCGQYMTPAHAHIDFVGHAHLTARLLEIDPAWNWEPVAWTEEGTPYVKVRDKQATMWIKLTIRGVTRLGVGSVETTKDDVEKELIGDALRNAGMRFGLALRLWAKSDLMVNLDDAVEAGREPSAEAPTTEPETPEPTPMRQGAAKKATTAPERPPAASGAKKATKATPAAKKAASAPPRPAAAPEANGYPMKDGLVDLPKLFSRLKGDNRQKAMAALSENPIECDEGVVTAWPLPSARTLGESGEPLSAENLEFVVGEVVGILETWAEGEGVSL